MKAPKIIVLLFTLLVFSSEIYAQRVVVKEGRGRRHPRHRRAVVIVRSPYRPARVVVYHPYWRPHYTYHRRWVYFPRYNMYWDNWRNQYVFWNGTLWISQPTAPPVVVNVNLENEKTVELKEDEDDVDDIYKSNDTHKTEVK